MHAHTHAHTTHVYAEASGSHITNTLAYAHATHALVHIIKAYSIVHIPIATSTGSRAPSACTQFINDYTAIHATAGRVHVYSGI